MPRSKGKQPSDKKPQKYDSGFKDWVEQKPQDILPVLLPGTVYEKTLNVETIPSPTRADKVFKVLYCGKEHILHLEFETGLDRELRSRLLVYNSVLYRDYKLPVIRRLRRNVSDAACFPLFSSGIRPPLCGWSEVASQVALTYAASLVVGLAAQQAGRPDLIRSPKRVLAHLWEGDSEL